MEKIIQACGEFPNNFIEPIVSGNDYIFNSDPNFVPRNLYSIFGKVVTVNSFEECFYYIDLGWRQTKLSTNLLIFTLIFFVILIIFKHKFKILPSLLKNKSVQQFALGVCFIFEILIVFKYLSRKANIIPNFVDEYVVLASNVSLFTQGVFSAGDFLGGPFSIYLTSGPVSNFGAVLGWLFTSNIIFSRIFNYFWVVFLNILLLLALNLKHKKINYIYSTLIITTLYILIPWWQGILYGLGEVASMVIFVNATFLYNKSRKLSMGLFGISIFLGKLLTLLPFTGFYFFKMLRQRKVEIFYDFFYFLTPVLPWFLLIHLNYNSGNFSDYIMDTLNLLLNNNSASGVNNFANFSINIIKNTLKNSEIIEWSVFDIYRISLIPILSILLIFKNRTKIDNQFSNLSTPIIFSIILPYLWFWLISPLKWIRYSQHFMVTIILLLAYLLIFDLLKTKYDYFLNVILLSSFIENEKNLIIIFMILISLFLFIIEISDWKIMLNLFLLILIILDIGTAVFKAEAVKNSNSTDIYCVSNLSSEWCRKAYLNND